MLGESKIKVVRDSVAHLFRHTPGSTDPTDMSDQSQANLFQMLSSQPKVQNLCVWYNESDPVNARLSKTDNVFERNMELNLFDAGAKLGKNHGCAQVQREVLRVGRCMD